MYRSAIIKRFLPQQLEEPNRKQQDITICHFRDHFYLKKKKLTIAIGTWEIKYIKLSSIL